MSSSSIEGTQLQTFLAADQTDWRASRRKTGQYLHVHVTDVFQGMSAAQPLPPTAKGGAVPVVNSAREEVDSLQSLGTGHAWETGDRRDLALAIVPETSRHADLVSIHWDGDAPLAIFMTGFSHRVRVWTPGQPETDPIRSHFTLPAGHKIVETFIPPNGPLCLRLLDVKAKLEKLAMLVPAAHNLEPVVPTINARPRTSLPLKVVFGALALIGTLAAGVALYRGDLKMPPRILASLKNLTHHSRSRWATVHELRKKLQ